LYIFSKLFDFKKLRHIKIENKGVGKEAFNLDRKSSCDSSWSYLFLPHPYPTPKKEKEKKIRSSRNTRGSFV
jgi:hypothetical protein